MVISVEARTTTWTKDSHGLFDYESTNVIKARVKTYEGSRLVRTAHNCVFAADENIEGAEPLLLLSKRNGKIYLRRVQCKA